MRHSQKAALVQTLSFCAPLLLAGLFASSASAQMPGVPGTPGGSGASRVYLGGADRARGTSYRTITGNVTDEKGKPVESAMVYLKNVKTSGVQVLLTDSTGAYRFSPLSLSEDFQLWAQEGDRTTVVRPISQFNPVPLVSIPLRFDPKTAAEPKPAGSSQPH